MGHDAGRGAHPLHRRLLIREALRRIAFRSRLLADRIGYAFSVPLECRPHWPTEGRESPYATLRFRVGDRDALICYGRPSVGGRQIFGGLVPHGDLWRTGANEPTTLHLPFAARIAGLDVPKGRYSLYTVPGPDAWTLVINRATRQSGRTREERGRKGNLFPNDYTDLVRSAELGRAPVEAETVPHVEQLTLRADEVDGTLTNVLIEWETARAIVPVALA